MRMNNYDILVIGGGAAGLNAALVLLRARRRVAVVDAGHPRNATAAQMRGFLSRDGMSPAELLAIGRSEIAGYGGDFIDGTVAKLERGFRATLADGTVVGARRVLAATGLRDLIPDIPGLAERWGRDVLHCPYCHGYEVRDQALGVIGGGDEAIAHAVLIRQWSDDVTLFAGDASLTRDQAEVLAARGVRIQPGVVRRLIVEDDALRGVELEDGRTIARTVIFVRPTFTPQDELLRDVGCEPDEHGWIAHDAFGATSVPGIYVAGNAADPRAQVVTAAGQGSAAAIAINADLVAEDLEAALRLHRDH